MAVLLKHFLYTILDVEKSWQLYVMQEWRTIVGDLYQHMCLEKIVEDTLYIGVYHPHWLQELHLLSPTIIRTINRALHNNFKTEELYVKRLRLRYKDKKQGVVETRQKKSEQVQSVAQKPLTAEQKKAVEQIKDPELAAIMNTLLSFSSSKRLL